MGITMNHDYSHCLDYQADCPVDCFRARITKELKERGGIATFSSFKGTDECIREEKKNGSND